jgi:Trk-type K+ transport system membrane component
MQDSHYSQIRSQLCVDNPLLNITITAVDPLGGIGFAVMIDLYRYVIGEDKVRKLNLHSKIVLYTSGLLLLIGFIGFYWAEYNGSMQGFFHQPAHLEFLVSIRDYPHCRIQHN